MTQEQEYFDEAALLEAVKNQLAEGYPLQVKATLMRLRMTGVEEEEALQYLACALGAEIMEMEAHQQAFDVERYVGFLNCLPEMPWAEDGEAV